MKTRGRSVVGRIVVCLMGTFMLDVIPTSAQSGSTFDPSFSAGVSAGSLGYVGEIVIQDDGRVLIGGDFSSVGGAPRRGIARIHPDGELDTSFNLGSGLYLTPNPPGTPTVHAHVRSIALYPDGRILIAGAFDSVGGHYLPSLARLLPNGAVDPTFDSWPGDIAPVDEVALQADGRILIGGWGANNFGHFACLNADGSYDQSFEMGTGFFPANIPSCIRVQGDGRILVAGGFQSYNGVQRRGLIRLLSDGQVDESFAFGTGVNTSVSAMDLYADGSILISGSFTSVNGVPKASFARIFPNGEVDLSFDAGTGATFDGSQRGAMGLCILSDGKVCASGIWEEFQGQSTGIIECMLPNGGVDPSFGEDGPNHTISAIAQQGDGRILVGGVFSQYYTATGPISRPKLARIMGSAVGVEEHHAARFTLRPNPTNGLVALDLVSGMQGHGITLFDATGRAVLSQPTANTSGPVTVDLSGHESGVYFVQVRFADGTRVVERLVKE